MWKPSVTPSDVIRHSQGPWKDHKYVKVVDDKYYYPNSYDNGRTVSDLKGESSNKATRSDYSKDDSDFDDRNYNKKNAIGNTEFYGFKGKDGRNVVVMEDKKWSLPEGTKIDSKLKKRLEAVSEEIAKRREKGEKISADEWNKLVNDAINGTSSKSSKSSSKRSSRKSSTKSSVSAAIRDSTARTYGKSIIKSIKDRQKQIEKERKRRQNMINRKAYLNHSFSDELAHHGILGMKWGVTNGPPYPLKDEDHSAREKRMARKMSRQERAEARKRKKQAKHNLKAQRKAEKAEAIRQKVIKTGDAKQIAKYKGKISNEEYDELFKRLANEKHLDELTSSQMREIASKINSIKNVVSGIKATSDAAIDLYNNGADVYNAFLAKEGSSARSIERSGKKKKKRQSDDDD